MLELQKNLQASGKNPVAFCYLDDKAYSEGSIVAGRICQRRDTLDAMEVEHMPLVWGMVRGRR